MIVAPIVVTSTIHPIAVRPMKGASKEITVIAQTAFEGMWALFSFENLREITLSFDTA